VNLDSDSYLGLESTNTDSQTVFGVYSTVPLEVNKVSFFILFRDIVEAPTDCYFMKKTISDTLT
jgi:hypothetical protein